MNSRNPSVEFVDSPHALHALCELLGTQTSVAVDTEADSLYSYFEKLCLAQFSTREADYIVDPLALSLEPLASFFADARIEKVFHAAEYDILCLKREYHFTFANIFDTMVAARILGWKQVGLGTILHERFGVTLNKKMQRADWGRRPLSAEQLEYARRDTHYLLALRDLQKAELEQRGYWEEAREEFERLTRVEPMPRRFDPDAYWNIKGARDLDAQRLGALRELFRWRNEQARREDRPPFKVLSDAQLLQLAQELPSSPTALARLGVAEVALRRYSHALLAAIARGATAAHLARPRPRTRPEELMDYAARARLNKLKAWRKQRAQARGVENDVIVSNEVLYNIARENPRTLEALAQVTHLGPWKLQTYGEEILRVLHK